MRVCECECVCVFVLLQTHPILSSNEVQLVYDEEAHILDVLALLPPPGEHVPVLRCAHYHISLCVGWIYCIIMTSHGIT